MTLSGADTVAHYQQVLRTVTYNNASQNPNTTSRVIEFTANDGALASNLATTTLSITAVNDAPVNSGAGAQSVNEDTPLSISGITVNDVDGNLQSVGLSVANGVLERNPARGGFDQRRGQRHGCVDLQRQPGGHQRHVGHAWSIKAT